MKKEKTGYTCFKISKTALCLFGFFSIAYTQNALADSAGIIGMEDSQRVKHTQRSSEVFNAKGYQNNQSGINQAVQNKRDYSNSNFEVKSLSKEQIVNNLNKSISNNSSMGGRWVDDYLDKYKGYGTKDIHNRPTNVNQSHEYFGSRESKSGNKRTVFYYGEKDKANQSGLADSTFIAADDYSDRDGKRIYDCSEYEIKVKDVVASCPAGLSVADNIIRQDGSDLYEKYGVRYISPTYHYDGNYNFRFYHFVKENKKKEDYPKAGLEGWWHALAKNYHYYNGLPTPFVKTTYNADGTIKGTVRADPDVVRNGVQLFEFTYKGKGKVYAESIEACKAKFKITDPSTYSSRKEEMIEHNCAKACPSRTDDGAVIREEITQNCATKEDRYKNRVYSTDDKSTITAEYPQGVARKVYIKKYKYNHSKGYMIKPSVYKDRWWGNYREADEIVHSCDLYEEVVSKQSSCTHDELIVKALIKENRYKEPPKPVKPSKPSETTNTGSGSTTISTGTKPKPPKNGIEVETGNGIEISNEISENSGAVLGQSNETVYDRNGNSKIYENIEIKQFIDPKGSSNSFYYFIDPRGRGVKVRELPFINEDGFEDFKWIVL